MRTASKSGLTPASANRAQVSDIQPKHLPVSQFQPIPVQLLQQISFWRCVQNFPLFLGYYP